MELFAPISGRIYQETVVHTKKLLEIVALFGGQWPHSSDMVPGGVTTPPSLKQIVQSIAIVDDYIRWYESSILGCSLETWLSLTQRPRFSALDE